MSAPLLISEQTSEWMLQVPATVTKTLVGKQGHIIRELQKESGTIININREIRATEGGALQKAVIVFHHPRMHLPSLAKAVCLTFGRFDRKIDIKLQFPVIRGIDAGVKEVLDSLARTEGMNDVVAYIRDDPIAQDCVVLTGPLSIVQKAMFTVLEEVLEMDKVVDLKKMSTGSFGLPAPEREKPAGAWMLTVSAASSRLIIGRGGQNIRHIESTSGARIRIATIGTAGESGEELAEVNIWHDKNDVPAVAMACMLALDKINGDDRVVAQLPQATVSREMVQDVLSKKQLKAVTVASKPHGVLMVSGPLDELRVAVFMIVGKLIGRTMDDYGRVPLINYDMTLWAVDIPEGEVGQVLGRAGAIKTEIQDAAHCLLDIRKRSAEAAQIIVTPYDDGDILTLVKGVLGTLERVDAESPVTVQMPRTRPGGEAPPSAEGGDGEARPRTQQIRFPADDAKLQKLEQAHPGYAGLIAHTRDVILLAGAAQDVRGCLLRLFNDATGLQLSETVMGIDIATAWYIEMPRRLVGPLLGKKMQTVQRLQAATGATINVQDRRSTALALVSCPGAEAASPDGKAKKKPTAARPKKADTERIARTVLLALDRVQVSAEGGDEVTVQVPCAAAEIDAALAAINSDVTVNPQTAGLHISGPAVAVRGSLLAVACGALGLDVADVDRKWALDVPRASVGPLVGKSGTNLRQFEETYPDAEILSGEGLMIVFGADVSGAVAVAAFYSALGRLDYETSVTVTVPLATAAACRTAEGLANNLAAIASVNASGRYAVLRGSIGVVGRALGRIAAALGIEVEGEVPAFCALRWRLSVPRAISGHLIGKAGRSVQEIREATGARLTLRYDDDNVTLEVADHKVDGLARAFAAALNKVSIGAGDVPVTAELTDVFEVLTAAKDTDAWLAALRERCSGTAESVALNDNTLSLTGDPAVVLRALVAALGLGGSAALASTLAGQLVMTWWLELAPAAVGLVIGARGATVRQIEGATGARVNSKRDSPELVLKGAAAALARTVGLALERLDDADDARATLTMPMLDVATPDVIKRLTAVEHSFRRKSTGRPADGDDKAADAADGVSHTAERISIRGERQLVMQAVHDVLTKVFNISDVEAVDVEKPPAVGWQLEMPRNFVGRVVGRGGRLIRRVGQAANVRVTVRYRKTALLVLLTPRGPEDDAEAAAAAAAATAASAAASAATAATLAASVSTATLAAGEEAAEAEAESPSAGPAPPEQPEVVAAGTLQVGGTPGEVVKRVAGAGRGRGIGGVSAAAAPALPALDEAASEQLRYLQAVRMLLDVLPDFTAVKAKMATSDEIRQWASTQTFEPNKDAVTPAPGGLLVSGTVNEVFVNLTRIVCRGTRRPTAFYPSLLSLDPSAWVLQAPNVASGLILGKNARNKIEISESTGMAMDASIRPLSAFITYSVKDGGVVDGSAAVRAMVQTVNNLLSAKDKTSLGIEVQLAIGADKMAEMEKVVRQHLTDASQYGTYAGSSIVITGVCSEVRACLVGALAALYGDTRIADTLVVTSWNLQLHILTVPLVVGKGGASIRSIENDTGVKLAVDQRGSTEKTKEAEVIFTLGANSDQVAMVKAVSAVLTIIAERVAGRETRVVLTVPRSALKRGAVLRKGDDVVLNETSVILQGNASAVRDVLYTSVAPYLEGSSQTALAAPLALLSRRGEQWAMELPQSRTGRLIGKAGASLNEIRDKSLCKVTLPESRNTKSDNVVVLYRGESPLSAPHAIALSVDRLMESDPVAIQFPLEPAQADKAEALVKAARGLHGRAMGDAKMQCDDHFGIVRGGAQAARTLMLRALEALGHDVSSMRKEIAERERMYKVELPNEAVGVVVGKGGAVIRELERLNGGKKLDIERGKANAEVTFGSADMDLLTAETMLMQILDRLNVREYVRVVVPLARDDRGPVNALLVDLRPVRTGESKEDIVLASSDLAVIQGPAGVVRTAVTAHVSRLRSRDFGRAEAIVSAEFLGALIGKGGDTIRQLEETTGATIHLNRTKGRNERNLDVSLAGTREAVYAAVNAMTSMCDGWRPLISVHGFGPDASDALAKGPAPPAAAPKGKKGGADASTVVMLVPVEDVARTATASAAPADDESSSSSSSSDSESGRVRGLADNSTSAEGFVDPAAPRAGAAFEASVTSFLGEHSDGDALTDSNATRDAFAALLTRWRLTTDQRQWAQAAVFTKGQEEMQKAPAKAMQFFAWTQLLVQAVTAAQ